MTRVNNQAQILQLLKESGILLADYRNERLTSTDKRKNVKEGRSKRCQKEKKPNSMLIFNFEAKPRTLKLGSLIGV